MRRGLAVLTLLAAALVAGAVVADTHPAWLATARQDAQGAASALATALATPPPSPPATPPATATSRPSPPPITLAPARTSPPPVVLAWSADDCAWAIDVLAEDATLDQQAQDRGQSPVTLPTYYAELAGRWQRAGAGAAAACATPSTPLAGALLNDPPQWFLTARATHQVDEVGPTADRAWDDQWIATYTRLLALWAQAGATDTEATL